ncbi:MAG TPA: hypothetical protein VIL03_06690 [Clostridia bacterium]|jgi:hypothetical protein
MLKFLKTYWPSLLAGAIYCVIEAVIRYVFKKEKYEKAYLIFVIISLIIGIVGVIAFTVFINDIVVAFGIILGLSLGDLIIIRRSAKYK